MDKAVMDELPQRISILAGSALYLVTILNTANESEC